MQCGMQAVTQVLLGLALLPACLAAQDQPLVSTMAQSCLQWWQGLKTCVEQP